MLGTLGLVLGGLGWAYIAGRKNGQASDAKAVNDAAERVADAVGAAPGNRDELVDRLRKAGL